jgi:hypothetical protein
MILLPDIRHAALRPGSALVFFVLLAVAGPAAVGAAGSSDLLPPAAFTANDNSFEISAAPSRLGLRGPVLFFADQFRKDFLRTTKLALGRAEHPIVIRLGSRTNDLRVAGWFAAGVTGGEQEQVEIPDPEHADLDLLRTVLAQALAREWCRALPPVAAAGRQPPREPPAWLLAGVARHVAAGNRLADFDRVQTQWLRGRLPSLADILAPEPPACLLHPALQAVLAAWLLDRPGEPFGALLRRLAEGTPWSPAMVAEALQEPKGLAGLCEEWDAWLIASMREIRQVGVTTPGLVSAFRAQLQIYPGDYGLPFPEPWRGRSPDDCLAWPATPEVRQALRSKAMAIRIFSAGRDGALQRAAVAYACFLDALAVGEAPARARSLLAQAEAERKLLEERTAAGDVLCDPVAETPVAPVRKRK